MEEFIPNFKDIIVYGSITFYQVLGFLTTTLAFIDALIYASIIYMFRNSQHDIGKDLKLNYWVDIGLMLTTDQIKSIALAVGAHVQRCFDCEKELTAQHEKQPFTNKEGLQVAFEAKYKELRGL